MTTVEADASSFRSDDACRAYLERLRWPDGVQCPRCGARKGISRIATRGQFECDACRYQFSVGAGTAFHNSHLPLWKWVLAVLIMDGATAEVPVNQLKDSLDVSYKTAWLLRQRIRSAARHGDTVDDTLRRLVGAGADRR